MIFAFVPKWRTASGSMSIFISTRAMDSLFMSGKGQGGRALSHLSEEAESRKCARLAELELAGLGAADRHPCSRAAR